MVKIESILSHWNNLIFGETKPSELEAVLGRQTESRDIAASAAEGERVEGEVGVGRGGAPEGTGEGEEGSGAGRGGQTADFEELREQAADDE